jgi:hypothetical protein
MRAADTQAHNNAVDVQEWYRLKSQAGKSQVLATLAPSCCWAVTGVLLLLLLLRCGLT